MPVHGGWKTVVARRPLISCYVLTGSYVCTSFHHAASADIVWPACAVSSGVIHHEAWETARGASVQSIGACQLAARSVRSPTHGILIALISFMWVVPDVAVCKNTEYARPLSGKRISHLQDFARDCRPANARSQPVKARRRTRNSIHLMASVARFWV